MLNKILLQGRLTASPELKTTNSGKNVTSFSLAVERDFATNGERETDFINIVAWGGTAEFASKYFTKGRMMLVEGRLQVRKYTTQDGGNRYVTEVVAEKVYFAGDKAKTDEGTNFTDNDEDFTEVEDTDSDLPF